MIDPSSPDFRRTPAAPDRPGFRYAPVAHEEPLLSIVTTFCDTEPLLFAETAASVAGQSLQQWEWLIVDDGSTRRDAIEALRSAAAADARIRVVRHDGNRGVPAARNTGIREARGRFVLQLDSDDLLEPTAAETWLWFLLSYPEYDFVNSFQVGFGVEEYLWARGFHERERFLAENLTNPTGVVRRELFDALGGYDEELHEGLEDWEFWLRCAAGGRWGATLPDYLFWHRRKGDDAGRWANWDRSDRQAALLERWREAYTAPWNGDFPRLEPRPTPEELVELDTLPLENRLQKSRRRVLVIAPWATAGGADKFNVDLLSQLIGRGWEATVATTLKGDHSWLPRLARLTPDVFPLTHFLKPADYARFLRYLIRSRQPDVVLISSSIFAYTALPYLRRAAPGVPFVDYCHVAETYWLNGGYARLSVERAALLDLQITASRNVKDWMVEHGADAANVEVAYIDIEPAAGPRRGRRELDLPEDPVLVYPCRLVFQKQPQVFAKTVLALYRRGRRFLALVVGDGPYLHWLRRFVARHGLDDCVRFYGHLEVEAVRELMAASDCVFLPSASEGVAVVLYEAMAEGVPVVAADVGGQRELVTPECGVLVERADEATEVERYADALQALFDDPAAARAMGGAARDRISAGFTLDRMGERMDGLLRRAVEKARTAPIPVPSLEDARRSALEAVRIAPWSPPESNLALPSDDTEPHGPVFDLVLATAGRTDEPRRLLASLEAQTYLGLRLIVVDQNPDNRLDDVVAGFHRPFPILHLRAEPGNSAARNVGLSHADADIVAFPDDDCWYAPDTLERVARLFDEHGDWDGISGRSVDADGDPSGGLWDREAGRITRFNIWRRTSAYTVFLRGETIGRTGFFDETLGLGPDVPWPAAEDIDYVLRSVHAGQKVHYEPSLQIFHEKTREQAVAPRPDDGYRYGLGVGRVLRKNGLPPWFAHYLFARSYVAAKLSHGRGDFDLAEFYRQVGRGRREGWRARPPAAAMVGPAGKRR